MTTNAIDRNIDTALGRRFFIRDIPGPPGAPAVLLLHGLGATARLNWGPSFRPLSEHFRVVALDHRGHGRGRRTRRFRLEQCADDAADVLGALDIDRAVVVGYSMGGPIASITWRRHRERVAGLVLCATARHFVRRRSARGARALLPGVAAAARLVPGLAQRRMLEGMLGRIHHPALRARVMQELGSSNPATVVQAAAAVAHFSSHAWIEQVDVPTAVIVTTRDELVPPERQRGLAAAIPGARVYEVEGDHAACVAKSDVFVPTLVEACDDVAVRAGLQPGGAS